MASEKSNIKPVPWCGHQKGKHLLAQVTFEISSVEDEKGQPGEPDSSENILMLLTCGKFQKSYKE